VQLSAAVVIGSAPLSCFRVTDAAGLLRLGHPLPFS
jgi:hypothetical protein